MGEQVPPKRKPFWCRSKAQWVISFLPSLNETQHLITFRCSRNLLLRPAWRECLGRGLRVEFRLRQSCNCDGIIEWRDGLPR